MLMVWFSYLQESLMAEEIEQNDLDHRSMKDPVPSTSRSMLDIESQNLVGDDGFGSSGFGRKSNVFLYY